MELHGRDHVLAVSGFALGRETELPDGTPVPPQVRFNASRGVLLPQLGWNGKVECVVVRLDEPNEDGARYLPLTSSDGKATIKTGVHFPPSRPKDIGRVRVVEGIHKANIATQRTDTYTIGMPDSGWWTPAFEFVQQNIPDATIMVCPDADVRKNGFFTGDELHEALIAIQDGEEDVPSGVARTVEIVVRFKSSAQCDECA